MKIKSFLILYCIQPPLAPGTLVICSMICWYEKIISIFFIIFLSGLLGISWNACTPNCESNIKAISHVTATQIFKDQNEQDSTADVSTLTGPFYLSTIMDLDKFCQSYGGLITSTYASKASDDYVNGVDYTSIQVFVNQDFELNNQLISKNTDLLTLKNSGIEKQPATHYIRIKFTTDFVSAAQFNDEIHIFSIKAFTTDNRPLFGQIALKMKL